MLPETALAYNSMLSIDPETAWNAFEGLMSLTDKDGVIGGESLPSRKPKQPGYFYQTTQDKERLEKYMLH